jgi:hypothetical protein
LTLYATLPARAGDGQGRADVGDALTVRNCLKVTTRPLTDDQIDAPGYSKQAVFQSNCVDYMIAQRLRRQEQELPNRSAEATLLNCVRLFFSIADDGTEYELRFISAARCGTAPRCTTHLTLVATDGIQTAKVDDIASGLIRVIPYETGQILSLRSGEFSCAIPENRTDNRR